MLVNTTYEPYSQQPEYLAANRAMLQTLPAATIHRAFDLACGTGVMTKLWLEIQPQTTVIGIDLSAESLEFARKMFAEQGLLVEDLAALEVAKKSGKGAVLLIEGSADDLPFEPASADLVLMGGAIHLIPDKERLLRAVSKVLRPRGLFVFNTVFYVGTYPEGTESFYTEWLKEALLVLQEKNEILRAAGKPTIPRQRGKGARAFTNDWKSPSEWCELLANYGLPVSELNERTVMMSKDSFATVGAYSGLAEVLMSGYPVDVASECLQIAANRVFSTLNLAEIPRKWLEVKSVNGG